MECLACLGAYYSTPAGSFLRSYLTKAVAHQGLVPSIISQSDRHALESARVKCSHVPRGEPPVTHSNRLQLLGKRIRSYTSHTSSARSQETHQVWVAPYNTSCQSVMPALQGSSCNQLPTGLPRSFTPGPELRPPIPSCPLKHTH